LHFRDDIFLQLSALKIIPKKKKRERAGRDHANGKKLPAQEMKASMGPVG
jgi:hypothetical protein